MLAPGEVGVSSAITMKVTRFADKQAAAGREARAWRRRNWWRRLFAGELFVLPVAWLFRRVPGVATVTAELRGVLTRADGTRVDLGTMGRHLVTTAGKTFLASAFANSVEPEIMKYHGFGTGTTAAAAGDTTLQTELTTQYATDNTRPTGSQSTSTNTYTTVGTLAPDASCAVTEWGLLSQAANSGGTLFDRQVFSALNLISGDSLAVTYVLTIS
jgi:hypothetical protein